MIDNIRDAMNGGTLDPWPILALAILGVAVVSLIVGAALMWPRAEQPGREDACDVCGLPDPYRGDGDGIGSCDCPRCGCGAGEGSYLCTCPPYDPEANICIGCPGCHTGGRCIEDQDEDDDWWDDPTPEPAWRYEPDRPIETVPTRGLL